MPIVVHLFDLRRYRKVYFSNVNQLEQLQQASRQESQLRRRLLLAARIAAIVFLVLAFANPSLDRGDDVLQPGTTAVSVYIDNSFSMLQQSDEGSLLECAKRKAAEVAAAYSASDRFQLLTNNLSGEEFHWLDRDDFLSALDELTVSPNSVMLSEVVRRQQGFLHDAVATNRRAYLLSDFQRSTADMDQLADSAFDNASSVFVPLQATTVDNIYLDTLIFDSPSFRVGDHVNVEVRIRSTAERTLEQVPLHLYVEGRRRAQTTVTLSPHGEAVVPMRFVVDHNGAIEGCVATADSPVTFDDTLFFALNVAGRIAVLDIHDARPNPCLVRLFGNDTAVDFRTTTANEAAALLSAASADVEYDWVVLDAVSQPSSLLIHALHDYVERGGSVTVVVPNNPDEQAYTALLQPLRAPLLGKRVEGEARLSQIDYDHALFRSVFATRPKEVEMPRFTGWFTLRRTASAVVQDLLSLPSGDAVLTVFYPVSQRPCYLFAAPLQESSTALGDHPLFVPTFYNMALYSRPPQQPYLLIASDAAPEDLPVFMKPPARMRGIYGGDDVETQSEVECMPNLVVTGGRSRLSTTNLVGLAGCYRLTDATGTVLSLAFNYGRTESEMEFLAPEDLPHDEGLAITLDANRPMSLHMDRARSLSHLCLWLALAMLLADVVLSRGKRNVRER